MKKKTVILAALIIGIYGFPIEAAVPAGGGLGADAISMGKGTPSGNALDSKDIENRKENGSDSGEAETDSLQIPLETTVIIDPWEIDGRGQVYSERYVIQNTGTEAGTLVLSNLTCISEGQDEAVVKTDKARIHSGQEKSVYVEMVFENEDKMIFGQEDSEYQVKLEPKDKLVFWFAGEVNENASQLWQDGDITVTMECSWKTEEMVLEADNGIAGTVSGQMMDKDRGQTEDAEKADGEGENNRDMLAGSGREDEKDMSAGSGKEDSKYRPPDTGTEKEDDKDGKKIMGIENDDRKDMAVDTDVEETVPGREEDGKQTENTERDSSVDITEDVGGGENGDGETALGPQETVLGQGEDLGGKQTEDTESDGSADVTEDVDAGESGDGETALEPEGNKDGQQMAVEEDDSAQTVTETELMGSALRNLKSCHNT